MKRMLNFFAETARKFTRVNLVQKFVRDLGSLRALWNYLYLALYVFVVVFGVVHYGKDCINTAINTTGTLCGWIFINYVFFGHMDKRLGNLTPMIGTSGWTGDAASKGDADNPIVALESPAADKSADTPAAGGDDNG